MSLMESSKMNVLYICHERDLNGASKSLLSLIDEGLKTEIVPHVLIPYKDGSMINELRKRKVKTINKKYYRWIISKPRNNIKWLLKRAIFLLLNLQNQVLLPSICRFIKLNSIELIHTNSSVVDIGAFISQRTKIPHIFHIREFGEEDFNMYPIYNKNKRMSFINANTEKIIGISKAIIYKNEIFFPSEKMELIYNGIPTHYLHKKNCNLLNDRSEVRLLIAGRIEEAKGQTDAVKAVELLVNEGYDNLRLLIIGSGDRNYLNNYIFENNLTKFIRLEDYSNDLFSIRKSIDIELICSKSEAFGRVTIESMFCSNPVIGANSGGTKELIIDGYNGFLYRQGDYNDLALKIKKLIHHEEFDQLSQNSFDYAKKNFTSSLNAKRIHGLYMRILENNK